MKFQLYFWILFFIFSMQPGLEAGKIYHWIDKDGVQHFTNLPPPPGAQIVEGLSETPSEKSPAGTRPADQKDQRKKGGEEDPAAPVDADAAEGDQEGSADSGDPGPVQSGDRRFRKWQDEPNDREDTGDGGFDKNRPYDDRQEPGAILEGEEAPTDREDPEAIESKEQGPSDRRLN